MIACIINGIIWWVKCVPPTYPELLTADNDFALGCCNNRNKTIYIADGLGQKMFYKVLCHEITHAAMFSYGVKLTIDQEELIADIIATYGKEIIQVTNKVFEKIKNWDRY